MTKGSRVIAVEFKASLSPKMSKGFWNAIDDIKPESSWVVIPEGEKYQLKEGVWVISLEEFLDLF